MRGILLASILSVLLGPSLGCQARRTPKAAAQARSHPRQIKDWFVRKAPAFEDHFWVVQSDKKITKEDALADALKQAQGKVREFLLEQTPPVTWTPEISFIKRELIKDAEEPKEGEIFKNKKPDICPITVHGHRAFEEEWQVDDPDIKNFHRVSLNVTITPQAWQRILEEQHNDLQRLRHGVMKDRMLVLLKIMGGLVALLATVAGYIRVDEWSKGYYTNWLRLAAMSCVGAVVAAGWWLFLAN
jgi:hypothetical protein